MLLSAGAIAFSVAYYKARRTTSHYPCGRYYYFGGVKPAIPCWPSTLFASERHLDEHNIITDDYLARSGQDDDAAAATTTVSSSSIIAAAPLEGNKAPLKFGTKLLKRAIFGSQRRGLPRTITTNKSNIQQHVIHLLSRLGRESCLVTILLLLLYRILTTTTTTSLSHQNLHKFMTTNVTRWMVASLTLKLITLQSQVVTAMDPSLEGDANHIDSDWFLKGQFYMKLQNDTAGDGDLLSRNTLYNNTAFAADDDAATSSSTVLVRIRQVPSDGSCLFHAIGARILYDNLMHSEYTIEHNNNISTECNHPQKRQQQHHQHHPPMSSVMQYSQELRQQAVNALQYNPQRQFTMSQGEEPITASSLVELAAEQYDISSEEYLTSMRDESVWGGGPEIIALASELKRQVVVLELETIDNVECSDVHFLKIRARLGDASNDGNNPIYILCTNQQFPESFGRGRVDNNHFLAVFPLEPL